MFKRLTNKALAPFRLMYWRMAEPQAEGVKVLIECHGRYLMIRNSYGPKHWTIPGGGKKGMETMEETAKRETLEEVGIALTAFERIGSYFHTRQYKRDTICCFYAQVDSLDYKIDPAEVEEAAWFTPGEIKDLRKSKSVDDVLALFELPGGKLITRSS